MVKETLKQFVLPRSGNTRLPFLNEHIEEFFTDTEYLQEIFEALLNGSDSAPRVLNIHAPFMRGKSALLAMFYLSSRSKGKYVALADARHLKTPQDILREMAAQLEAERISLSFYRKVLEVVLDNSVNAPQPWDSKVTETLAKRAETLAGNIPASKPWMVEVAMGLVDTLMYWRKRSKQKAAEEENRWKQQIKDEIALGGSFKVLRRAFIEDLNKLRGPQPVPQRSVVLMLDHLEEVTDPEGQLRDWVSELVSDPKYFVVLAGRKSVGPEWHIRIPLQTEVLLPMKDEIIAQLVRNYCKARGIVGPNDQQITNIVRFAAQVPILALWAIEICRERKIEDWDIENFLRHNPGVASAIGDPLESLLNVSTQSRTNQFSLALEAAAIVRWFNRDILKDLVGDLADKFYEDLEGLPIVSREGDHVFIPGPVRAVINRKLRSTDARRYFELNRKASESYERRLQQLKADPQRLKNKQTLVLENLYHEYQFDKDDAEAAVRAEEYFKDAFMDAFNRRQFSFCKSLLERVADFDNRITGKNWVKFYSSMMNWYRRVDSEGSRKTLETLAQVPTLDDELLASVYESLGWMNWYDYEVESAKRFFERALEVRRRNPDDVAAELRIQVWQAIIYQRTAGAGEQYLQQVLDRGDELSRQPQWEKEKEELEPILEWAHLELGNTLMLQGRLKEARIHIERSVHAFKRLALQFQLARALMTCGRLRLYMGQLKDAEETLRQSISLYRDYNEPWSEAWADFSLGEVAFRGGQLKLARQQYALAIKKWRRDKFGTSVVKGGLADLAFARGDLKKAFRIANKVLSEKMDLRDTFGIALTLNTIGVVLLAKGWHSKAQQMFEHGLQCARACRSFMLESLLQLGVCRVYHFRNDQLAFNETAKTIEDLANQYGFLDHLAEVQFLKATLHLRNLAKNGSAVSEIASDELAEMFCESFSTALSYNIFLLDALAERMKTSLQEHNQLRTGNGDFVQQVVLRSVRNRWRRTTQSNAETLQMLERNRRSAEPVDQSHRQSLLDRLKEAA